MHLFNALIIVELSLNNSKVIPHTPLLPKKRFRKEKESFINALAQCTDICRISSTLSATYIYDTLKKFSCFSPRIVEKEIDRSWSIFCLQKKANK